MPPFSMPSQPRQEDAMNKMPPPLYPSAPQSPLVPYPGGDFYSPEFVTLLESSIKRVIQEHTSGALMFVSITNLAMIVNAYGHDTSEIVMHDVMRMVQALLREGDVVHRVQRDQLGIILTNSYPDDVTAIAARVHNVIQNFGRDSFDTAALYVMGKIGSVNFPLETSSAHDALDKAYIAVNSAQVASHHTFEMTRSEADECRKQMGLANYLFKAFKENRLRMAYQPVIKSTTGEVLHYEALLRLVNQTGNIASAGILIPVAEKMGLIDVIDTMVMEMVIEELRKAPDLKLAFNVSNLTTEDPLWLDAVTNALKHHPDIASRLVVEITETAAHRDLRRAAFFVASLQSLGCQVALDDFGSGYTSFRQLKALSVDMVKIDGAFIKDLSVNSDNRFFVKTLLEFAQGFGLQTVAEFVETGDVAKILIELGVDCIQGYYFGKPANHRPWLKEGEFKGE